jgi:hypothetical protein
VAEVLAGPGGARVAADDDPLAGLSGDRAPFDQGDRWAAGLDPMVVEAAAWETVPVVPRGESEKASAASALIMEQDALDVDRIQISDVELSVPLADSSDPIQDACVLSSDGLISSPEGVDPRCPLGHRAPTPWTWLVPPAQ